MRILLITKAYPPNPSVSGMIAYNIGKELCKKENTVDVLTVDDIDKISKRHCEGQTLYIIPTSYWEKIYKKYTSNKTPLFFKIWFKLIQLLRKVFLALQIRHFPNVEKGFTKAAIQTVEKIVEKNGAYDVIIAFFRPYSCLDCMIHLKKKYPQSYAIAYYLDLVESRDCPTLMPQRLYDSLIERGDRIVFQNSDCIVLPTSAKTLNNPLCQEYKEKIEYLEFPTFIIRSGQKGRMSSEKDNNEILMVFAGTLSADFRNPVNVLELLSKTATRLEGKRIRLKLFGRNDCPDLLAKYKGGENFIVETYGLVSKETVEQAYDQADYLINIMNAYQSIVPSKIFELFSEGKPILNFGTNGDDGSLGYFRQYPLCHYMDCKSDEWNKNEIDGLKEFLLNNVGERVEFSEIVECYSDHTPQFVTEQLIHRIYTEKWIDKF